MPKQESTPELEILLPVHNEAESIEATIREIYRAISTHVQLRFILCEDGSKDDTKAVLTRLAETLPITLCMSDERKGYSRAVRDGMALLDADYLLCLDSDGQCDPADFGKFWEHRTEKDLLLGWRVNRADTALRRTLSRIFFLAYQTFYHVPVHDPSCPFMLAKRPVICSLLPELGEMKEGFWWEFVARAHLRGFTIHEIPVHHRLRIAGQTQVYRFRRMPGIGWRHFVALFKIRSQTRPAAARDSE